MRKAITWLVFEVINGQSALAGQPQFIVGRAELEHPDIVTVTTRRGRIQGTCPHLGDPEQIARDFLRELHRTTVLRP